MKIRLLLFYLLFFTGQTFSQTDTIRLEKSSSNLYRCDNTNARYWYLYEKNKVFYLVNLTLPEAEIGTWFQRFVNSQNLYRCMISYQKKIEFLHFTKPNAPDERLSFEITNRNTHEITTTSLATGELFVFRRIEF